MMQDFEHPRLGKLEYDHKYGWDGWISLPLFAECRSGRFEPSDRDALPRIEERNADPADEFDSAVHSDEIDEQLQRMEGKLPFRIEEVGRDGLSPAQERSLDYLLNHEAEVLDEIFDQLFRWYRESLEDRRAFERTFGAEVPDVLPREIHSPEQLKNMTSFSHVEFGGDAIDGFVMIRLSGTCEWDDEHGLTVELLKDRVLDLDEDEPTRFPARVPEQIDLTELLPIQGETHPVEFRIYGRWSGIYQIDEDGLVVDRDLCLLCPGRHWDPEGVEEVRVPASNHLRIAMSPLATLLPGLASAGGCFAPLFLLLGFLFWGGFYWVSLTLSVLVFSGRLFHPLLRMFSRRSDYLRLAIIAGLAIAGIVYWQKQGGGVNEGIVSVIGWVVWALSAFAFLISVKNLTISLVARSHAENPLPLIVAWPNILFAVVVGAALWKTYQGDVSKLHLIWAVPVTFVICFLLGIRMLVHKVVDRKKSGYDDFFSSSHKDTFYVDPDDEDREDRS